MLLAKTLLPTLGDAYESTRQWLPEIRSVVIGLGSVVPISVVAGLTQIESSGRPDARSVMNRDSRTGRYLGRAHGLMQIMPFHFGAPLDANGEVSEEWRAYMCDPVTNLTMGVSILIQLYAQIGDWTKTAAAYFGAFDWSTFEVTEAQDANGVTGRQYVNLFTNARSAFTADDLPGLAEGLWTWPVVGSITQRFEWTPERWGHTGLDIAAPIDTSARSPVAGVVLAWRRCERNSASMVDNQWGLPIERDDPGFEWLLTTYGSFVIIGGESEFALLGHTGPATGLTRGQTVAQGQIVGLIDNTGKSSGPHVHLERRANAAPGVPLDPALRLTEDPTPPPPPPTTTYTTWLTLTVKQDATPYIRAGCMDDAAVVGTAQPGTGLVLPREARVPVVWGDGIGWIWGEFVETQPFEPDESLIQREQTLTHALTVYAQQFEVEAAESSQRASDAWDVIFNRGRGPLTKD